MVMQGVKIMGNNCCCRCRCTTAALIVSAVVAVVTAFLLISGTITVTPAFLRVALGIAVGYQAVLLLGAGRCCEDQIRQCGCNALTAMLAGILATVLFSLVLLAIGITATSAVSAILVGLLVGSLALVLTATACLIRSLYDCRFG